MHLPIRVVGRSQPVEVPFSLQPSFKFACFIPGHGVQEFVADLSSTDPLKAKVPAVESTRGLAMPRGRAILGLMFRELEVLNVANAILAALLSRLGLVEVDGDRIPSRVPDALLWIGIAHEREMETQMACEYALADLAPVWRDRTEPAPKVHVAADILDSYYQQVMDEVLGEWEDKAHREAADYLTSRTVGGNSEVAP